MNIWSELGIQPTSDPLELESAYAARLRQVHPEDDREGFQRLRAAYEAAVAALHQGAAPATPGAQAQAQAQDAAQPPAPSDAAAELVRRLMYTDPDRQSAVLASVLEQPGWEPVDFRMQLQHEIAGRLLAQFDKCEALIGPFARSFGWSADEAAGDPAVAQLMARNRARAWRRNIESEFHGSAERARKAMAVLRGPADVPAFYAFAQQPGVEELMRRLVRRLREAPVDVAQHEADPVTLRWWEDYIARRESPAQGRNVRPGIRLPIQLIIFLVVILGLLARCSHELGHHRFTG